MHFFGVCNSPVSCQGKPVARHTSVLFCCSTEHVCGPVSALAFNNMATHSKQAAGISRWQILSKAIVSCMCDLTTIQLVRFGTLTSTNASVYTRCSSNCIKWSAAAICTAGPCFSASPGLYCFCCVLLSLCTCTSLGLVCLSSGVVLCTCINVQP